MDFMIEMCLDYIESSNNLNWQPNDIVQVSNASKGATRVGQTYTPNVLPIKTPKKALIYVINFPNGILTLEEINNILTSPEYNIIFNPPIETHKRKWRLDFSSLSTKNQEDFLVDKYITLSFSQIKGLIFHKTALRNLIDNDFSV